jgi:hypothetical protein
MDFGSFKLTKKESITFLTYLCLKSGLKYSSIGTFSLFRLIEMSCYLRLIVFDFITNDLDGDRDVSLVLIVDRLSAKKLRLLKGVDIGRGFVVIDFLIRLFMVD